MKSPISVLATLRGSACALGFVVAGVVPFVTGCAEEGAEGPEVAYPVGTATQHPVSAAEYQGVAGAPVAPPAAPYQGQGPESGDVVVGAEPDPGTDGTAPVIDGAATGVAEAPSAPPVPGPSPDEYADTDPSALTDFHTALDPYGAWVDDATYGTAWVPSASVVGDDFAPYQTAGHWTYDDDYTWVSDYNWGWAPFHYGRWVYAPAMGWEWIPGRAYAGAWVSWRYGWGDWAYVGWAPLSPTWCWRRGVAVGLGFVPVAPYRFVATGDLFARGVGTRVVTGERVGVVAGHTRPWVPASPALGGRVVARPAVGGPPPSSLRIPTSAVATTGADRGVMQARYFARPGAAAAFATSRPAVAYATPAYGAVGRTSAAAYGAYSRSPAPAYGAVARASAPAYGPPAPSHFGGRFGAGFTGSTAGWGPTRAPTAAVSAPPMTRAPPSVSARPYFAAPSHYAAPPSSHVSGAASSFQSAPSFHGFSGGASTGGFHSGGGYSGGFHGGSSVHSGGGGGFHSGGGGHR